MAFKYYEGVDLEGMVTRFRAGYLTDTGWLRSAGLKEAVDNTGPVAWYTYPALEVLSKITDPEMQVFEYGGGGSTLWWSKRVARVISVDHDTEWVERTQAGLRETDSISAALINAHCETAHREILEPYFNLDYYKKSTGDPEVDLRRGLLDREFSAYAALLLEYPPETFDIICVDGMARNLTAWLAAQYVKPGGMIIFDNAERDEYAIGYEALRRAGFVRIDFSGPGPINPYAWTTSIWTKSIQIFKS
jgi:hypothetical protein